MNLELKNKVALVTASTGGIGLEIARSLAEEGATVLVNGRSAKSVNAAIASIREGSPEADLKPLVTDNGTAEGASETIAQYPEVDILVNNLGIYEAWLRIFEVNVLSGVRLSRHYLKKMLEKNSGKVVFISSESGLSPAPEMAHYSATKSVQLSLSRSLAELTKGTKVTVNAVLPGSTRTEGVEKFVQDVFPNLPYEEAERNFMKDNRSTSLIQRLIDPREIAHLVTFVCSGKACAINGSALRVDGGIVKFIA